MLYNRLDTNVNNVFKRSNDKVGVELWDVRDEGSVLLSLRSIQALKQGIVVGAQVLKELIDTLRSPPLLSSSSSIRLL